MDGNVGAGGTADGSADCVLCGAHPATATSKMLRIIRLVLTCVLAFILVSSLWSKTTLSAFATYNRWLFSCVNEGVNYRESGLISIQRSYKRLPPE